MNVNQNNGVYDLYKFVLTKYPYVFKARNPTISNFIDTFLLGFF